MRVVIGQLAYRSAKTTLYGQGTLRLSDGEARAVKVEIWESVSAVLARVLRSKNSSSSSSTGSSTGSMPSGRRTRGSKTSQAATATTTTTTTAAPPFWFLGGDAPTEIDTTLFGFIVSVVLCTA